MTHLFGRVNTQPLSACNSGWEFQTMIQEQPNMDTRKKSRKTYWKFVKDQRKRQKRILPFYLTTWTNERFFFFFYRWCHLLCNHSDGWLLLNHWYLTCNRLYFAIYSIRVQHMFELMGVVFWMKSIVQSLKF